MINSALDEGAHLISGMIGTPNNLAVRDILNEECVPHLEAASGDPAFGEVADYPWTMGSNLPYDLEWQIYAEDVAREFPDGATAALFYVNNDAGTVSKEGFEEAAEELGIEIVDDQTIEAAESAPPTAQLGSIAGNAPDVIVAFPLGAQCPVFLSELANQKAANSGWEPRVYLTNTCASPLILGAAGDAANGLYTSGSFGAVDITNPETHTIPGVAEYLSFIEARRTLRHRADERRRLDVRRGDRRDPAPGGGVSRGLDPGARSSTRRATSTTRAPSSARASRTRPTARRTATWSSRRRSSSTTSETKFLNDVGELITEFESS